MNECIKISKTSFEKLISKVCDKSFSYERQCWLDDQQKMYENV